MMEASPANSPRFALYRTTTTGACVMIEIKDATGEPVAVAELICYEATRNFPTGWYRLTIKRGSKLMVTPDTAAHMLADGRVAPVPAGQLMTFEERKSERWKANAPKRKLLRERMIAAGRLRPIDELEGPKA